MRKSWKTHWETIIHILMRDEPTWWRGLEKCGTGLRTSQKQMKCLIPWRTEPWRRGSYKGNLLTTGFWFEKLSDGGAIVKGHLENNPESQWWPVNFWVPGLGRSLNPNLISIWPGRCDRGILACVVSHKIQNWGRTNSTGEGYQQSQLYKVGDGKGKTQRGQGHRMGELPSLSLYK